MEKDKATLPDNEQLKELLDEATPGNWIAKYNTEEHEGQAAIECEEGSRVIAVLDTTDQTDCANIDLVCLAPTLAAEVIQLRSDNKVLREALAWISKVTNSPEIGKRCDKVLNDTK